MIQLFVFCWSLLVCTFPSFSNAAVDSSDRGVDKGNSTYNSEESSTSVFNLPRNLNLLLFSGILAGLILVAMLLDHVLHLLHHGLSSTKLKMLEKLKDELMVLGLISFILTMMEQSGVHLPHDELLIFEFTHILVFVVALMLVLYTAQLMLMESRILRGWHALDAAPALYCTGLGQDAVVQKLNEEESKGGIISALFWILGVTSNLREGAEFHVARALFLDEHGLGERFDFTEYLHRVLVASIVEILDVSRGCWLIVILLDLLNLLRDVIFKELHIELNDSGMVVFMAFGLLLVFCDLAIVYVGRKLWWQCLRLAAPLLRNGEKLSVALVDARSQQVITKRRNISKDLLTIIRTIHKLTIEIEKEDDKEDRNRFKLKRLSAGRRIYASADGSDVEKEAGEAAVPTNIVLSPTGKSSKREAFSGLGKKRTTQRLRRFGFGVETMVVLQCFYTACFVLYFVVEWTRLMQSRTRYGDNLSEEEEDIEHPSDDATHRLLAAADPHETVGNAPLLPPPEAWWLWILLILMILPVPVHILFVSQRNLKAWTLLQAVTLQHRHLFKDQLEATEEREQAYSQLRANFMVKFELESSLSIVSDNPEIVSIFSKYCKGKKASMTKRGSSKLKGSVTVTPQELFRQRVTPRGFMRLCQDCSNRHIKTDHLKAFVRMADREQRFFDEAQVNDVSQIRSAISKHNRGFNGVLRKNVGRTFSKSKAAATNNTNNDANNDVADGTYSFDTLAKFFRGLDVAHSQSSSGVVSEEEGSRRRRSAHEGRLSSIDDEHGDGADKNEINEAGLHGYGTNADMELGKVEGPRFPLGAVNPHSGGGCAWENTKRTASRHGQQLFRKRYSIMAFQTMDAAVFVKPWGESKATPLDYVVVSKSSDNQALHDIYAIPREEFERNYEQVSAPSANIEEDANNKNTNLNANITSDDEVTPSTRNQKKHRQTFHYRKKETVFAQLMTRKFDVAVKRAITESGEETTDAVVMLSGQGGDYIVRPVNHDPYIVEQHKFLELYEPVLETDILLGESC